MTPNSSWRIARTLGPGDHRRQHQHNVHGEGEISAQINQIASHRVPMRLD